ncbi:MAG TPA: threonine-phosphate decarboxylase CobD [Desulfuromonadaceae bacterium]
MATTSDHGGNVFDVARELGTASSAITDFSASINPLGLSPLARQAIVAALDSLVHYPDAGHRELKQALADHHGISTASVVVANGSTELIYRIPSLLTGRRALIVAPAFSEYLHALERQGWETSHLVLSAADGFELDPVRLERALAEGYDALYLCNPGNPSGRLYPLPLVERVYHLCRASDTFLVLDEAFMDFCEEASAKRLVAAGDNAVILRSMTKFFAIPGLRLGYAIANEAFSSRLGDAGAPWSVNTLALAAGTAALRDREHCRRTIEFIREERGYLAERLSRFPMLTVYPSGANYLLVGIADGPTARELRDRLLPRRLLIRDCANFVGLTPRFFRIAVRTREENERLLAGLERLLTERLESTNSTK